MRFLTLGAFTARHGFHPHAVREAVLGGRIRIIHAGGKPLVLVGLSSDATTNELEWPLLRKRNATGLYSHGASVLPVVRDPHQEQPHDVRR